MTVSFGATSPACAGIWCRKPVELRAQIERARSAGINPTHIDAHMAAAMLPELLDCHVRLGHDYGLVPVLPRKIRFAPDPQSYDATVAGLERAGLPVVDHIRGTLPVAAEAVEPGYRKLVEELPASVTHFALHCTAPRRATSRRSRRSTRLGAPTNIPCSHRAPSPSGARRWASCRSATGTFSACGARQARQVLPASFVAAIPSRDSYDLRA
jgi:hypothetical protein